MLKEMKDIFKKYDIRWCAFCGTLLGAIRDENFPGKTEKGKFKPYDFDIDVMIFQEDKPKFKWMLKDFSKLGYSVSVLNMKPMEISKKGEWIDLWLFGQCEKNNDYIGCGDFSFHKRFFEKLRIAKIKDIEVFVPNFAEEFLGILYGPGWRIPNPKSRFSESQELYEKLMLRMEKGI